MQSTHATAVRPPSV